MEEIDECELADFRSKMIIFIINNSVSKVPIQIRDLQEIVNKKNALYKQCFPKVCEALQETYGIVVKEVPDTKSSKKIILLSEESAKSLFEYDNEQKRHLVLLFVILSYIFMTGHPVYEEKLESFLQSINIELNEEHEYFGNQLRKLITDTFVKQLYLKKEKSTSEFDTDTKYLYSWGYRSTVEFSKKQILEATAKILGRSAEDFVSQYHEAQAENSEDSQVVQ